MLEFIYVGEETFPRCLASCYAKRENGLVKTSVAQHYPRRYAPHAEVPVVTLLGLVRLRSRALPDRNPSWVMGSIRTLITAHGISGSAAAKAFAFRVARTCFSKPVVAVVICFIVSPRVFGELVAW